jgi:hypothetical protein
MNPLTQLKKNTNSTTSRNGARHRTGVGGACHRPIGDTGD